MASLPPADLPGAFATQTEQRIGPLDVLQITVFKVDELSGTVQVDANGDIILPLIGKSPAAGKTIHELETEIASRLGEKYLQAPVVSVVVKESPGQRITVEGAVKSPGLFPLVGRTSLLQAMAMSGGLNDSARNDVTVFRTVQNQRMAAIFDLDMIRSGKSPDPEVYGGDLIVVGESGVQKALGNLGRSIPVVGVFTPFLL